MKTFAKRSLSVLIALLMLISMMSISFSTVSATSDTATTTDTSSESDTTTATEATTQDPSTRKVALAGNFNDWSLTDNEFEYYADSDFYHAIVLAPGTYTFKIVQDGLWYGANTIIDGSTSSDITMEITAGDCAIECAGGKYELYFNTDTKKLSITFTAMEFDENTEAPEVALSGSFNDWVTTDLMTSSVTSSIYYPACDASQTGLNAALTSIGVDNSKEHRMEIALVNGIEDYTYTPEQNTAMLKLLKAGKLINPDVVVFYPACDASYTSLNPALTSIGVDNSKAHRMVIALINGIEDYAYTAEQNKVMLDLLKAGKLIDPDCVSISPVDSIVTKTIALDKGEYYFSIVEGGLWYGNTSYKFYNNTEDKVIKVNGGACTLVTTGGEYTFIYNYATNTLSIESNTEYDPSQLTVVSLAGDFNNWSKTDLFIETSATTVERTIDLKKGTYYFKIIQDGLWYGNEGTIENTTTTSSNVGWEMSMYAGNCVLEASGGSYTFIYTVTTKMLTVEYIPSDEAPAEMATVTLAGDFNSWNKDEIPFEIASDTTVTTTISLTAGSYAFKVVEDGLWYGNGESFTNTTNGTTLSYIGSNSILVATGGEYTFTYDVMSKSLTITAELNEYRPVELSEVSLAGDFNGWDDTATPMTEISDEEVSATISIKTGAYYFKVVKDGLWYGNGATINNVTDKASLTYTGSECILVAAGGDYTFTFNVTTDTLTITFKQTGEDPAKTQKVALAASFNNWSTTANKLTYYATNEVSTTVELDPGVYSFKIVDEDLWYGWDEDTLYDVTDYPLELSSTAGEIELVCYGGEYTFVYDVITKTLKITCALSDLDPAETAMVSVAGDFNNWINGENLLFYEGSKNVVTTTVEITAGTYLFKIVHNDLWYGNGSEIANTTAGSAQKLSMTGAETKLNALGGLYTFNYNVITHELEVLYTEKEYDYTSNARVFVAGEFNNWTPDLAPMSVLDNKLVYANVPLEAGEYLFKIVHDGSWFGKSNAVINSTVNDMVTSNTEPDILLKAKEAGIYTFMYDVTTNKLSVYYDSEDFSAYSQVFLVGDFNNWDDLEHQLSYKGSGILSLTVDLEPGTYQFQILSEGTLYGNEGIINNTTVVTSSVGWAMTESAGNCTLKANGGSYTFRYNYYNNFLEVIYND